MFITKLGSLILRLKLYFTHQGFQSVGRGATIPSLAINRRSLSLIGSIPIDWAYSNISAKEIWKKLQMQCYLPQCSNIKIIPKLIDKLQYKKYTFLRSQQLGLLKTCTLWTVLKQNW